MKPHYLISFFIFIFSSINLSAHKRVVAYILVQLKSEHNRIDFLQKNKPSEVLSVQKEAARVIRVTINDFSDHFDACPVYYYFDTNADKIIHKNFNGIILDANMQPVNISSAEIYYLVYYGHSQNDAYTEKSDYTLDNTERLLKGLVLLNPEGTFIKNVYGHSEMPDGYKNTAYYFQSKKYEMSYVPLAGKLNKAFQH